ncbi:MAG: hypothetical protein ACC641_04595 [Acidiferrobacterales bacterium]
MVNTDSAYSVYRKTVKSPMGLVMAGLLGAFTVFPIIVSAANNETLFIPSIGVGRGSLSFARTGSALPDATDTATYFMLSVGGTVLLNRFYFNAMVDIPLSDDSYYSGGRVTKVNREDYNFTLGYSVLDWLSTYAGYTIGRTNTIGTTPDSFDFVTDHNDSGVFLGISLSKNFRQKSTFSFNLAYANLDGSIRTRTADPNPPYSSFTDRTVLGPTTGLGYGFHWTAAGKGNTSYFVKLTARHYSFIPTRASNGPPPTGVEVRKDLDMFSVGAVV